ncbi:MAG: hypothetical protein KF910_06885 [Brevundimonas sp.]|uniref:hypothetical protein n=1 Tax=Brevundimonas sp. TaxID=1871086 RepID=UPI0025C60D41|nr:hypothetical protein [Brevundimonas sp.]MBX3477314.1 hypothetical protein [Brevundimonas sp.]
MSVADFRGRTTGPADLFLQLWERAVEWSHVQREDALRRPDIVRALMTDLVMEDDGQVAVDALIEAIAETLDGSDDRDRGSILDAMEILDEVFAAVHPRSALLAPSRAPRPRSPEWLRDLGEARTLGRPFAQSDTRIVLPRGPFTTTARSQANLNGETLEDRFNFLTVAPRFLDVHGRSLPVRSQVVGHEVFTGVPGPGNAGREAIGVVVVAERADELDIRREEHDGRPFLDIRASETVPAGQRFFDGVQKLGALDIAMAPELTMSEVEALRYADALSKAQEQKPRLSIAGSGAGRVGDVRGRFENVSLAFNASGRELWRHSKVWPYAMTPAQVAGFKWDPIDPGQNLAESLVDGDHFTVADIDSLGRVITLICQDFQIKPAVAEAVRLYQPDWVLVPVLDSGTDFGRWTHQRAYDLSVESNARYVVASSLALSDQAEIQGYPDLPVAVLVGPRGPTPDPDRTYAARAVGIIKCHISEPMCGRLSWGDGSEAWTQTNLARPKPEPPF